MTDSARAGRQSQFIQFVQSMNEGKAFQSVELGCFRAAIRRAGVNPINYTRVDVHGSVFLRHEINGSRKREPFTGVPGRQGCRVAMLIA